MPFNPQVDDLLDIEGTSYRVTEHPAAPGIPYGQEGRQAVVYQIVAGRGEKRALKAFKPRYRLPSLVSSAARFAALAEMPGLAVCARTVLSPRSHAQLLRQHPDLAYAVLMPWIEGPTWFQVVSERRILRLEKTVAIGRALADLLSRMEQRQLAHCDLSSPNLILPMLDGGRGLQLVDVEQIYAPNLDRPEVLPAGSPGYAHVKTPEGLWAAEADRFAGGVLLAEILVWADEEVRTAAWGESYFAPDEMHQTTDRFEILVQALRNRNGDKLASLFERTWHSTTLQDCPPFREWAAALDEEEHPERVVAPPIPRLENLFQETLAGIEEGMAPKREEAASLEREHQEELDRLYRIGLESIERNAWAEALEVLDTVRTEDASFADVQLVAEQAESGWLQSLVPEIAAPMSPTIGVQDWAAQTGAADRYADNALKGYVAPQNYQALYDVLSKNRMLILEGPPGIGKRSTAFALAQELRSEAGDSTKLVELDPDVPLQSIASMEDQVLVWVNPFGISTFAPPPLADRVGLLKMAVHRNHLVITTPSPLRRMALRTTGLGLWPAVTQASMSLGRADYTDEALAEILHRQAQQAEDQGIITPRQRHLIASPERRLSLASQLDSPLMARLFVEYALARLDPTLAWSVEDLELMVTEVQGMRQSLSAWFSEAPPSSRLFVTILSWLAGRPRSEVATVYSHLTRELRASWPGLPIETVGTLAHRTQFCVSAGGRPGFKHPVYQEVMREVIADRGTELALHCLDIMQDRALSAASHNTGKNSVPLNVSLLLGELAERNWGRVAPVLEHLARSQSADVKWAVGQGLMHAVQKQPSIMPSEASLLHSWSGSEEGELHLAALQGARHLGRIAMGHLGPVFANLIAAEDPTVRIGLVDAAAELTSADWEASLSTLSQLASDVEETIREAVASSMVQLAAQRRRAIWSILLEWAKAGNSLVHGTVMRVLLEGQEVFSLEEVVPIYERLLSREDDAGAVLASHLAHQGQLDPWSLSALTELARKPSSAIRTQLEGVLTSVASQNPQGVVDVLCGWSGNDDPGVRETALRLMARVGTVPMPKKDRPADSETLGGAYARRWFKSLRALAIDPMPGIRARLVREAHAFASMDAQHTVALLAVPARDEMPQIRQLTALALSPLAEPYASQCLPVLEQLIADDDRRVREATIPALADGVSEVELEAALTMLSSLVRDSKTTDAGAPAFVRVASNRAEDGAAVLSRLAEDKNPAQRTALLDVARRTAAIHPAITSSFVAPLATDRDRGLREQVIDVCRVVAQRDAKASLPVLTTLVLDPDPRIRARAMDELAAAGLKTPEAGLQALHSLGEQHRPEVQLLVLGALERFVAHHAQTVLTVVKPIIASSDPSVRRATLPVIGATSEVEPANSLEMLSQLLVDEEARIRDDARNKFLSLCVSRDPRLMSVLSKLVTDSRPKVFLPVLEGLAHFTATQPDAVLTAVKSVIHRGTNPAQVAALPLLEQLATVRLTAVVHALGALLYTEPDTGPAHKLYWRIMRVREGGSTTTVPSAVVRAVAVNPKWDNRAASNALSLREMTLFVRKRIVAKLTGNMEER